MASKKQTRVDGRTSLGRFRKGQSGNPTGRRKTDASDDVGQLVARADGWMSSQTGIGVSGYDKRLSHFFRTDVVTWRDAVEMWQGDDLAARAIETIPQECFRRGYELSVVDDQDGLAKQIRRRLTALGVDEKIEKAYKFERAFGGAALLLGINDGQEFDKPVDLEKVRGLEYVTVLEPVELTPIHYYADPGGPKFGEPSHYQLNVVSRGMMGPVADTERTMPTSAIVHETRLVIFEGLKVSAYQPSTNSTGAHWGYSTLTRFASVLRDFNVAWQSAGIVVVDFSQSVFTMDNLVQLMASNKQAQIAERLRMIELARSTARAVLIDKNESYTRQTTSLSGLPDLLDRLSKRLAAAIDMPLSLLMGVDAAGGSEGEAGIRFFYDRVASIQNRRIRPILERIVDLLVRVIAREDGTEVTEDWSLKFHPLWEPTDAEKAAARATQANTDNLYIQMGVLTPEEVRKNRFEADYSFETRIDPEVDQPAGALPGAEDPAALEATGRALPPGAPPAGPEGAPPPAGPTLPNGQPAIEAAKVALNGAQVTSLLEIVRAAVAGEIDRAGAVPLIAAAYPTVTAEQAEAMLGSASFKPKVPPTEVPAPKPEAKPEPAETADTKTTKADTSEVWISLAKQILDEARSLAENTASLEARITATVTDVRADDAGEVDLEAVERLDHEISERQARLAEIDLQLATLYCLSDAETE